MFVAISILRQQKIKLKTFLSGKTRALCKRMFCCIFWQYFYIVITLFAAHSITISNLHLLSISFSLSRERTVTLRIVDALQFVILTFGVSVKSKSNAAPFDSLTQKILSNNCGCISQCMKTKYCEILQLLLPHVYSIIGIYKRALPSNVGQFVSRLATFNTKLYSILISIGVSSTYKAVRNQDYSN